MRACLAPRTNQCSRPTRSASAVWFVTTMGLLDEAIREHLELKRRRGADPAEVARPQREALDPVSDRSSSADPELSTEEHSLDAEVATEGAGLASEARGRGAPATAAGGAPSSE